MSRFDSRIGRFRHTELSDNDIKLLATSVRKNFRNLEDFLSALMDGYREVRYEKPEAPEQGMLIYADGSNWNPGSGEGYYEYRSDGNFYKL